MKQVIKWTKYEILSQLIKKHLPQKKALLKMMYFLISWK